MRFLARLIGGARARVLGGAAVLVVGLVATATPVHAANSGFVRVQNGQFVLNGQRFDFVGTVAFALLAGRIYGLDHFTTDIIATARANGFRAVRTWGYFDGKPEGIQPTAGQFNESALQALDWVVKQFDDAGIRLIVPLTARYRYEQGGMELYVNWAGRGSDFVLFYTDPAVKALYKTYVQMLLNRTNVFTGRKYKDEPTILAWELADEPNLPDNRDPSGNIFHAWATEMSAFIKSIDPNHLVGTGEEGWDTSPQGYSDPNTAYLSPQGVGNAWLFNGLKSMSYSRNTAIPTIDFGTFKFYPEYWNMADAGGAGEAWIRDHARIAAGHGKPVLFSEFGHGDFGSTDDPTTLNRWMTALAQAGGGGATFWQLAPAGWWCDQFCVHTPPSNRISDALKAAAAVANDPFGAASGPFVHLSLDKTTIQPADTVDVLVTAANPGPAVSLDVFFGVRLPPEVGPSLGCPAGDAVVFLADAFTRAVVTCASAPLTGFPALFRDVTLPAGLPPTTVRLQTLVWPPGIPSGGYTFFLGLTPPNAFSDGHVDTADVVVVTTLPVVAH
jgi:mannan endo-1,4-beta-mannosidase